MDTAPVNVGHALLRTHELALLDIGTLFQEYSIQEPERVSPIYKLHAVLDRVQPSAPGILAERWGLWCPRTEHLLVDGPYDDFPRRWRVLETPQIAALVEWLQSDSCV